VTAIYGSDFSVAGAIDPEFKTKVAWDADLLSGYEARFLARVASGGGQNTSEVRACGLIQTIRALRPAVVLVNGYSPAFHQVATLGGLCSRASLLFRGEVNDEAGSRSGFKRFVRALCVRALYRAFARFLYVGTRAKEHYLRHGVSAERLHFSPYAVDVDCHLKYLGAERAAIRDRVRSELGVGTRDTVILFAGKLYEAKGPLILIEALRRLDPARLSGLHLVVMGDGELRAQLESQAGEVLGRRAHFVGFQNQSSIGRYFCAADCFVLPSFSETWGLVVNEALVHGLPCVVTDRVGCGPDLVMPGVTGQICPARSTSGLADALRRCLTMVGQAAVASACRQKAAEFSIGAAARGVAEAYRALHR